MSWDYNNPYTPYSQTPINNYYRNGQQPLRYSIIRVDGENGARAMQMSPNSETLALDKNNPIVWLLQTDGAGYLSVTPFDIVPHQTKPPVEVHSLEQRIARLEEKLNAQPDTKSAE